MIDSTTTDTPTPPKITEMNDRHQAAALSTVMDKSIQNPRASELRRQFIDHLQSTVAQDMGDDSLRLTLAMIDKARRADRPVRRFATEG
jgi:hypothetical protein